MRVIHFALNGAPTKFNGWKIAHIDPGVPWIRMILLRFVLVALLTAVTAALPPSAQRVDASATGGPTSLDAPWRFQFGHDRIGTTRYCVVPTSDATIKYLYGRTNA